MEFLILGPVQARVGGRVIELGGPKARALPAALLLHANRPVAAKRLTMELCGADASARMLSKLRVSASRPRRALTEASRLATTPGGYVLQVGAEALDIERFRGLVESARGHVAGSEHAKAASELSAALALWRGPSLADVATAPFAPTMATRLEEERAEALELRIDADPEIGRAAAMMGELRQLVAHPWRERHHAQHAVACSTMTPSCDRR